MNFNSDEIISNLKFAEKFKAYMIEQLENQINDPDPDESYVLQGFTDEEMNTFLQWVESFYPSSVVGK